MQNLKEEIEVRTRSMERQWEYLPPHVLELILDNLPVPDYHRFSAVSTYWRDVQREHRLYHSASPRHGRQTPWLLLPEFKQQQMTFYSPSEGRSYHLPLPPPRQDNITLRYCCGSSHGWLLLLESDQEKENTTLLLLNPFTRSQVHIPLPSSPVYSYYSYFTRGVLSSVPTDSDCVVLLWHEGGYHFMFALVKEKIWTNAPVSPHPRPYLGFPAICGGKVYVWSRETSGILAVDLFPIPATSLVIDMEEDMRSGTLVESDGQLLMVRVILKWKKIMRVDVYNVDLQQQNLTRLESLGDRVLFIGDPSSFSLSTTDAGVPGDRFYLTLKHCGSKTPAGNYLWIEYDYEKEKVMKSKIQISSSEWSIWDRSLFWMVPSL